MRSLIALLLLSALSGCASDEYANFPEPTGPWVPANPPAMMTAPSIQSPTVLQRAGQ